MGAETLFLADEADTIRLGEDLARAVRPGDLICLSGDLGAGKSTFARALIRAIADDDDLEVPSPTFTLVQTYALRVPVAHFDLYRIADGSELDELGLDDALSDGVCLVEWPEQAEGLLPERRVTLTLHHSGEGREAEFSGDADLMSRIQRSLAIRAFLADAGHAKARRRHLTGDASVRAYERIDDGGNRLVLMDSPRQAPGPILRDGKYYQQIAHIAEDVRPFVAVASHLRERGFTAPDILHEDLDRGLLLLDDLGSDGVLDADGAPIPERYLEGVACLARLHDQPCLTDLPITGCETHHVPPFDRDAMQIEVSLLTDWYLPWKRGSPATEDEKADYFAVWDRLIAGLAASERNLLLRDFHSPNILWQAERSGTDRIGIIDFQDAMIGPTAYDVASLVQDARVDIPPSLAGAMMERYLSLRSREAAFDRERFLADWHVMAAQRNCKLVGIWVRLMQRDGKRTYMQHMPRTLRNLEAALAHPALAPLRDWCIKARIL
jgi:N-acetylmuramate 1-kinase